MIFQRTASAGTLPRSRPQLRGGTFALEPAESLDRLSERIAGLAERSLEPNPFLLPEFLGPAIQALGRGRVKLATFSDRDDLRFFAPVVAGGRGLLAGRKLTVWSHPYAPLGTPLIDGGMARQVTEGLLRQLRISGRSVLVIPDIPLDGPSAKALRQAARRRGSWTESNRRLRPILRRVDSQSPESFDATMSARRRKELDRQLRRLAEIGAVSFMSARTGSELDTAFAMFTSLEASGWKGRRGSALQRRKTTRRFAHSVVMNMAEEHGAAAIDVLRLGEQPIAALIRLEHAGLSIPWKIAYDESFAAFSPGKQLMRDETRRWLADPSIRRVDPVCEDDNSLIAGLWPERERYGALFVSPSRWGLRMHAAAALRSLVGNGRLFAKMLFRGRRRTGAERSARHPQGAALPSAPRR